MATAPRSFRPVGVLLLLQIVGLIIPFILIRPRVQADAVHAAATASTAVRLGTALLVANTVLTLALSFLIWARLAPGLPLAGPVLVTLAGVWLTLQLVDAAHLLAVLRLSERTAADEFTQAAATTMADTILAVRRWVHYGVLFAVEGWFFACFLLLRRAGAIPRLLALGALATVLLHFASIVLPAYLVRAQVVYLAMPLGLAELLVGGWLLLGRPVEGAAARA